MRARTRAEARVTLRADTSRIAAGSRTALLPTRRAGSSSRASCRAATSSRSKAAARCTRTVSNLAPAEQRDLGAIVLGSRRGIDLEVVDEQGASVLAWIEVGPYRRGARADDLYPPNINRTTTRNGR
jgi:hypothetical protein